MPQSEVSEKSTATAECEARAARRLSRRRREIFWSISEIDHDAPPQVRFYKNDTIHSYHSLPNGIKKMCPPRLPFFLLKLKTLHKKLTRESSPSLTEEMKGKQIVSERLPSLR